MQIFNTLTRQKESIQFLRKKEIICLVGKDRDLPLQEQL